MSARDARRGKLERPTDGPQRCLHAPQPHTAEPASHGQRSTSASRFRGSEAPLPPLAARDTPRSLRPSHAQSTAVLAPHHVGLPPCSPCSPRCGCAWLRARVPASVALCCARRSTLRAGDGLRGAPRGAPGPQGSGGTQSASLSECSLREALPALSTAPTFETCGRLRAARRCRRDAPAASSGRLAPPTLARPKRRSISSLDSVQTRTRATARRGRGERRSRSAHRRALDIARLAN